MDIPIDRFNLTVGFFVLIGLILLGILTVYLAGPDLFDFGSVKVKTYLPSTYGLKRGVPVTYLDMGVGHVKSVKLSGLQDPNKQIEVIFTVREDFKQHITTDFKTSLERQQFGGFLSGEIKLDPPTVYKEKVEPVQDGDELDYEESRSMIDDVTNFSKNLQDEILPRVQKLLDELTGFLERMNDEEGDFAMTLSNLRKMSEDLRDPEGELMRLLKAGNELAAELTDENNLLMTVLNDRELVRKINETADNMLVASQTASAVGEEAEDAVARAKKITGDVDEFLTGNLPRMEKILDNILAAQEEIFPLLKDARVVSSSVAQAAARIPGLVNDVQIQLKEMEDISRAVKNIFIIRWYLEDDSIEDPTVLKPLLWDDVEKRAGSDPAKKEE